MFTRTPPSVQRALSEPRLTRVAPLRGWQLLVLGGIGLTAFLVRLQLAVRGGGLLGIGPYDDGVHYAAAASLIHGRLPYRDFLFLQPPAIALAGSPFAALGQLFGDPMGLVLFRVAFQLVGGANAVLVALVLRRWGLGAAITGGLTYALFFPAVYDERTALLEPVGTAGVLLALLMLSRGRRAAGWTQLAAGLALGVACGFKIWYVVPALVVLLFAHGGRLRVLAGTAVAGCAIYLPFFVAAPAAMWQQVVLAQVGRSQSGGVGMRIRVLLGVQSVAQPTPVAGIDPNVLAVVLLLLLGIAALVALTTPGARVFVALLAATGVVLTTSPSFFPHYASLTAPAIVLLLGVAVGRLLPLLRTRTLRSAAVVAVLAGALALNLGHLSSQVDERPPVAVLQQAAARIPGCIASDDPTLLAVINVLSRDLSAGCPLRPDVGGYSFGPERLLSATGGIISRQNNAGYQDSVVGYLLGGDAFVHVRPNTALNPASLARLQRQPALATAGRFVIRQGLGTGSPGR